MGCTAASAEVLCGRVARSSGRAFCVSPGFGSETSDAVKQQSAPAANNARGLAGMLYGRSCRIGIGPKERNVESGVDFGWAARQ